MPPPNSPCQASATTFYYTALDRTEPSTAWVVAMRELTGQSTLVLLITFRCRQRCWRSVVLSDVTGQGAGTV